MSPMQSIGHKKYSALKKERALLRSSMILGLELASSPSRALRTERIGLRLLQAALFRITEGLDIARERKERVRVCVQVRVCECERERERERERESLKTLRL